MTVENNRPSPQWLESSAELIAAPSAWKSVPGFVRVAIWIWSLAIVLSREIRRGE